MISLSFFLPFLGNITSCRLKWWCLKQAVLESMSLVKVSQQYWLANYAVLKSGFYALVLRSWQILRPRSSILDTKRVVRKRSFCESQLLTCSKEVCIVWELTFKSTSCRKLHLMRDNWTNTAHMKKPKSISFSPVTANQWRKKQGKPSNKKK